MNMNMVDMVEGIGLKHQIPAGVGLKRDIAMHCLENALLLTSNSVELLTLI